MTTEIIKCNLKEYPVFHALAFNGQLIKVINRFLLWKKDYGGRGGQKLSSGSQRIYAYAMKYLFDIILKDGEIERWKKLTAADLKYIRDQMDRGKDALDRGVINMRTQLWAEFYSWCRLNGYNHNMHIKVIEAPSYQYDDDNMLAHTKKTTYIKKTELYLPLIDTSRVFRSISKEEWFQLQGALRKIDPVYEAVAMVMMTTGLRISGTLQLKRSSFLPCPELNQKESLDYKYIPKGNMDNKIKYTCNFPIETWCWLHQGIFNERKKRAKKYKKKFNQFTQNAFLTSSGRPVEYFDVWEAFKIASSDIKKKITPHMLRHTYATWTVLAWAEKEGVRPTSESFYKSIHEMLAAQLGHKSISTTKKYCRTASFLEFKKIAPLVSKLAMEKEHIKKSYDILELAGFSD